MGMGRDCAAACTSIVPLLSVRGKSMSSILCCSMCVCRSLARPCQIWAWIVKILVQETIGHQVWWYDAGAGADTFYNRLVLDPPDRRSDVEIQSYLQPAAPTEDYRQTRATGTEQS